MDLLLCGHYYRVSRRALDAAGAIVLPLPGNAGAAEAALLAERMARERWLLCRGGVQQEGAVWLLFDL